LSIIVYNPQNLQIISTIIKSNLTVDLIPKKWVNRNMNNPTFGHCHNASGCLYKVFSHKALHKYRGLDDEGIWHWWNVDLNGVLIDLTSEQYTSKGRIPPYINGEKSGMLGFEYKKRVLRLYERVMSDYEGKLNLFNME